MGLRRHYTRWTTRKALALILTHRLQPKYKNPPCRYALRLERSVGDHSHFPIFGVAKGEHRMAHRRQKLCVVWTTNILVLPRLWHYPYSMFRPISFQLPEPEYGSALLLLSQSYTTCGQWLAHTDPRPTWCWC
ncbi:hypothetical protein BDN67DRAFT_264117 [Paxillus ammoniavirescens]|nr:hypothetical protein BDN67DRAFT_264117 [Paxillus ammoniavirescens]